ncbi:hypothetical protein EJ04DRAFT_112098 [Polyplosphaeria fusca]|uniref:Uncharacterized protein n=1 Tax=Polyplosphaeria fusca TaxID=682080 RepID=A0A9P4RCD6_9PLEO|nr:hypothetical protein EJ04DRAFT_112098 [Polyplosphaeria fusca]
MAVQRPSVHVDQRQAVELDQPAPYPVHRPLIGQAQVHLSQRPLEEIGTMAASRPTKRKASCDKEKPRMHSSFRPRAKKTQTGYRKGKMTESGKAKASRMRKFGVCLRCKIYKAPCDTDDECHSCAKVSGSARIFKFRCSRAKLSDVVLARHSNGRFNQWQADYRRDYDWSMNYYDVDMLWNLPGVGPLSVRDGIFRLQIREYIPSQNEDTTTYRWVNVAGQSVGFEQPPYAVYDTNGFEAAFRPWLAVLMPMIEQRGILDRVQNDDIALLTFREAMRMRTSSNLLDSALKLLCLSLASQGYGTVFSNNVPGIHEVDHKSMGRTAYETYNRDSRDRPLPTAIAHTVDVGILRLLKIYQDHCLKAIGDKIFKVNNNKPWFELFIAMFVLLWNMEYVLNSAERYIGCKDRTVHGSQVRSTVQKQIDEYRASFPNLLEHWTIFLRGFAPFQMARGNPEELRTMSQMDDSSFIYTMQVVSIIDRKGAAHYPPPHTSPLPTMNEWIGKLLKSAGAWP